MAIYTFQGGALPPEPAENFSPDALRWSMVVNPEEFSPLSMQGDDSGNGLVMTSTAGASPPFVSTGVGALPSATFAGGPVQSFFGEDVKDWGFLHQPPLSGALYCTVAAGLNSQVVFRTKTAAATGGILLLWDGGALRFWLVVYDAAGGMLFSLQGAPGSTAAGDHQVTFRISSVNGALGPRAATPQAQLFVDGVQVASATIGAGAVSALAPLAPLTWGSGFAGVNAWTGGRLAWAALWSRYISTEEVADLYSRRSTIVSQRELVVPWLMGDSITANASAYRRWLDVRTRRTKNLFKRATGTQSLGTNFPGYDLIHDGVVGQTIQQMRARVNAPLPRTPTHLMQLAGTNNLGGAPPLPPIVAEWQGLASDMMARFPGVPWYGFTVPRGDGTVAGYNATVDAFNALLPAAVAALGPDAHLIDLYSPNASYPYDNATDAADGVGHPTPIGGCKEGNNAARVLGWGSD